MRLFEIDERIENFFVNAYVDQETGEVIYDSNELDNLQMEQKEKRKNIALFLKNLDSDIVALKDLRDEYNRRLVSATKHRDWLKSYLMRSLNGEDFECPEVHVKHKKNPPKVVWDEEKTEKITKWLKRHRLGNLVVVKTTTSLNKAGLKAAIKAGTEIPDVSVVNDIDITY